MGILFTNNCAGCLSTRDSLAPLEGASKPQGSSFRQPGLPILFCLFTAVAHAQAADTLLFKSAFGKWFGADAAGATYANRDSAGPTEKFVMIQNADGTASLRSANGHYVTSEPPVGNFLATRAAIGPLEKFVMR